MPRVVCVLKVLWQWQRNSWVLGFLGFLGFLGLLGVGTGTVATVNNLVAVGIPVPFQHPLVLQTRECILYTLCLLENNEQEQ